MSSENIFKYDQIADFRQCELKLTSRNLLEDTYSPYVHSACRLDALVDSVGSEKSKGCRDEHLPSFAIIGGAGGLVTGAYRAVFGKYNGLLTPQIARGMIGAGVGALVDSGLDSLFPSVYGRRVFAPNGLESLGIGIALSAPISNIKLKAVLIGAAWLAGRVDNWFEK